jgi:hypothetical protein
MPILKRRLRPVTFRVSADEYEQFTKACLTSGARSVSDFARAAVLHHVRTLGAPEGTLSGDLATLSTALSELDGALRDVSRRIHDVLGGGRVEGSKEASIRSGHS